MKDKDKYIILIIVSLGTILNIVFCFYAVKYLKVALGDEDNISSIAKISDNTTYEVNIIDNLYLEDNVLKNNYAYITDLVDYIKINFNYNYQINTDVILDYDYQVVATITATSGDAGGSPVWTKDYNLLEKINSSFQNNLEIKEEIDIYLEQFSGLVLKFIDELNISPIVNLEVKLIVNINENNHMILVNIPLNTKVFDINVSKNFGEEEIQYKTTPLTKETIFVKLIIYISLIIIVIFISYYLIKRILDKYKNPYILERNKILKDYDNRIVEVTNFIKYTNWETIDIKNMKELIELSNEAFEPILFWEKRNKAYKEAWFCILRDSILYKYVLSSKEYIKERTNF